MILAVASFCITQAQAQVDLFGASRTIVLTAPQTFTPGTSFYTNTIDIHGSDGIGAIDISSFTNAAGALTATLYGSDDNTNYVAFPGFAIATSTAIAYTNTMYGSTNLAVTDTFLLPGVLTVPTASSAGWATPYIVPAQFTNTGAITITAKGIYHIGFIAQDAKRYLHIVYAPTGASSNDVVSATVTVRRNQ